MERNCTNSSIRGALPELIAAPAVIIAGTGVSDVGVGSSGKAEVSGGFAAVEFGGGGAVEDGGGGAVEVGAGGIVVVASGSDVDGATVDGVGANTHSADPLTM